MVWHKQMKTKSRGIGTFKASLRYLTNDASMLFSYAFRFWFQTIYQKNVASFVPGSMQFFFSATLYSMTNRGRSRKAVCDEGRWRTDGGEEGNEGASAAGRKKGGRERRRKARREETRQGGGRIRGSTPGYFIIRRSSVRLCWMRDN